MPRMKKKFHYDPRVDDEDHINRLVTQHNNWVEDNEVPDFEDWDIEQQKAYEQWAETRGRG